MTRTPMIPPRAPESSMSAAGAYSDWNPSSTENWTRRSLQIFAEEREQRRPRHRQAKREIHGSEKPYTFWE
jgi:hypothetical protein